MNLMNTLAWDVQIEDALLRLKRKDINDPDYWYATVSIVEAGYDPTTKKQITLTALEAWVNRCKAVPQEDTLDANTPSRRIAPHRDVHNVTA